MNVVTEKTVAHPKNRPDFSRESGNPVIDGKVENKQDCDKGTPTDIVTDKCVTNAKNRPDFTKEV